jgi:hypothetical protein
VHFATLGLILKAQQYQRLRNAVLLFKFNTCAFQRVKVKHLFSIELPVFYLELKIIFIRLGLLDKLIFSLKGRQAIKRSSKAEGEPDNGAGRFPGGAAWQSQVSLNFKVDLTFAFMFKFDYDFNCQNQTCLFYKAKYYILKPVIFLPHLIRLRLAANNQHAGRLA